MPCTASACQRQLAARTGRSRTFYILAAIREHLDDLEDVYLAEQRLIRSTSGSENITPSRSKT